MGSPASGEGDLRGIDEAELPFLYGQRNPNLTLGAQLPTFLGASVTWSLSFVCSKLHTGFCGAPRSMAKRAVLDSRDATTIFFSSFSTGTILTGRVERA